MTDCFNNEYYQELLDYLYKRMNRKYPDCPDIDNIVQETLLAFFTAQKKQEIKDPKSYLNSILNHKYNDYLREKYRNAIVTYDLHESIEEEEEDTSEEYESVRREIGRLVKIYREVTVLYYVKGMSVEEISRKLDIPKGTVLSRLSKARDQVKKGIKKMEKYSQISYEPLHLKIGIWGGPSLNGAPFSLLSSPIEENILILAYQKPLSVKDISDMTAIPCAYIEPIIDKLVEGELMGRSNGGLVYTRCFIQSYSESLGYITAQERAAQEYAHHVWQVFSDSFMPLMNEKEYSEMSNKQKAEFLLFILQKVITQAIKSVTADKSLPELPPERKNGGRWLAFGRVFKDFEEQFNKYERSGPAHFQYYDNSGNCRCRMMDFQSVFGDTHYAYSKFKYHATMQSIMRFYASFVDKDITVDNHFLYDMCEDFQSLRIVRVNEKTGKHELDIPYISFKEWERVQKLCDNVVCGFDKAYLNHLMNIWKDYKNNTPPHIDIPSYYTHTGGLQAYPIAQMLKIIEKGLFPYKVEIGKTPLILLICDKGEE